MLFYGLFVWSVLLLDRRLHLETNKTDKVAINGEQEVEKNQSKPGWDPFLFINNPLLIADYPPASLWSMTRIGKRSSGFDFHRRTDFYQRSFEWL